MSQVKHNLGGFLIPPEINDLRRRFRWHILVPKLVPALRDGPKLKQVRQKV